MNMGDIKRNNDIKYLVATTEEKIEAIEQNIKNGNWLSPQLDRMYNERDLLKSAVRKIREQYELAE